MVMIAELTQTMKELRYDKGTKDAQDTTVSDKELGRHIDYILYTILNIYCTLD